MISKALILKQEGRGSLLILENGRTMRFEKKPVSLLNDWCIACGSSLAGRTESFRTVLDVTQKAAVMISEITQEIWFPTLSMNSADCIWICFNQILDVHSGAPHTSEIVFFSGDRIEIDCDPRTIRTQMKRCRSYLQHLSQGRYLHETDSD